MNGKFNPKMDTIKAFFPKSGQFFRLLEKGRRGLLPPPLVASLCTNKKINCTLTFFQKSKISFILDHLSLYISYKVKMSFLKESIKDSLRWLLWRFFLIYNQDSFEFWVNNIKTSLWFVMLCKVSQLFYQLSRASL